MTIVEWSAILSPIISVIIAIIMIWYNNRGTRKLVDNLRKLAKTNVELNIQQLELDLRREQLLSEVQQAKSDYLAGNHFAGYYKEAADLLKDQFEKVEGPKLMAKMHEENLAIQKSHLAKLKELEKDLSSI